MSVWLDLRIILRTIPAIASQIIEARSPLGRGRVGMAVRATVPISENFAGPATKT
jgi:hypothetical protein